MLLFGKLITSTQETKCAVSTSSILTVSKCHSHQMELVSHGGSIGTQQFATVKVSWFAKQFKMMHVGMKNYALWHIIRCLCEHGKFKCMYLVFKKHFWGS